MALWQNARNAKVININIMEHKDAISRLKELYRSDEYLKLNKKISQETYLSSVSKSHSETIFSSFICWIFNNPTFQNLPDPPLLNFLRLLANNAMDQSGLNNVSYQLMSKDLINAIITNNIKIISSNAETEVPVKGTKRQKSGKIDLVITLELEIDEAIQKVRIVLENKVYSKEHDNQCTTYYNFFSNSNKSEKKLIDNIFCYLSIDKTDKISAEQNYIKFNYQELLDFVLIPIMSFSDILPSHLKFYVSDFIETLTTIKSDNKMQIAMTEETRTLLQTFYENNKPLIQAAIMQSEDEEMKQAVQKGYGKIFNIRINEEDIKTVSTLADLVYTVVKHLAQFMDSKTLIETFDTLDKKYLTKYLISLKEEYFIDGRSTKRHLSAAKSRPKIICHDGQDIYVSNQLTKDNVDPFIKLVNETPSFGIQIS